VRVDMQFLVKLSVSVGIIIGCVLIGRRMPTLAGLIATMPLTSLIVLLWLYSDNPGDMVLMKDYTRGVLWGIVPTILFFVVAYFCFRRQISFSYAMGASFAVWLVGAAVHQWLLAK
jgi:uncharacterized membrane protein (GlpM family)